MSGQAITVADATSHSQGMKSASPRRAWLSLENRFVPPIFITLILLIGHLSFGILESYRKTLLAIGVSIATELILGKFVVGKWPNVASAYISGISVGILLRSPAFWPYALCAMIAITSKYVLRVKNRHIWNPSNFGICVVLFLAAESVTTLSIQWGNSLWAMIVIWSLGSVIIWRLKRFHICLTYVLSFLLFAVLRAWIVGDPIVSEISPITGPEYQLFIFFMITDPKTTVRSRSGQMIVAFLVAAVEMVFRLNSCIYAPLYALFIVGPAALLIETWWTSRKSLNSGTTIDSAFIKAPQEPSSLQYRVG
jgi:enediyne biosynthesis protein E5